LLLIAISILLRYGFADRFARILGGAGMIVITQLSSFFLVCIGVQIARIAGVGNAAFWLTKNTSPVELQTG
jgi:small neutral amino acid transporter SnatA (MarC family)